MARKPRRRAPGLGSIYQRGGGGWRIKWREGARRRYASGYPTRDLAEKVLTKILADLAANREGIRPDLKTTPTLTELAKDWLERRKATHRAHRDDRSRWNKHLEPFFGHLRPSQVIPAEIRTFVEAKIASGLSSTTAGHCVRLLSTFMAEMVERGFAAANPVGALPRSTRRLYRNAHDPRSTPFLERHEDIRSVFLKLEQPFATVFAIGALAGLRPGETLALEWGDIDLQRQRIHVQRQVRHGRLGPPKNGTSRVVPIAPALIKILAEWKLATGGAGQLFRPLLGRRGGRPGSPARFLGLHNVHEALAKALEACGLAETLTLYQCTRHTYASHWCLRGGSIEMLSKILGHRSITTTERYAHLDPRLFQAADLLKLDVDMSRPTGDVIDLDAHRKEQLGAAGCGVGAAPVDAEKTAT